MFERLESLLRLLLGQVCPGEMYLSAFGYISQANSVSVAKKILTFGRGLILLLLDSHRIYTESLRMPR